jgi:hypothetical protein
MSKPDQVETWLDQWMRGKEGSGADRQSKGANGGVVETEPGLGRGWGWEGHKNPEVDRKSTIYGIHILYFLSTKMLQPPPPTCFFYSTNHFSMCSLLITLMMKAVKTSASVNFYETS